MRTLLALAALVLVAPAFADDGGYWSTTETQVIQLQPSQYVDDDAAYIAPAAGPRFATHDWRGAYVGLNAQRIKGKTTYSNGNGSGDTFKDDGTGLGGTVGYTWQIGALTYGVEGDYNAANNKGDDNGSLGQTDTLKAKWTASARGRVGLAIGPLMPYVTAGWGWENHDYTLYDPYLCATDKHSATLSGATFGGGVEMALGQNTSAKIEYRRTKLKNGSFDAPALANSTRDYNRDVDTLMLGVNMRFMGPAGDDYAYRRGYAY